ncbi:hypothetical protein FK521_29790, partial [Klebsiella pneumoniae]|nr:hypothetical protein [Klebsiella pneumoniae]
MLNFFHKSIHARPLTVHVDRETPHRQAVLTIKPKDNPSRDLDVRLDPQAVPVELERLALSFNHMLERIEDVFTRQS